MRGATLRKVKVSDVNVTPHVSKHLKDSTNIMKKDFAKVPVITKSGRIATSVDNVTKNTRQQRRKKDLVDKKAKTKGGDSNKLIPSPNHNISSNLRRTNRNKEVSFIECLDGSIKCKTVEDKHSNESNKSNNFLNIVKKVEHNKLKNKVIQPREKQYKEPKSVSALCIGRKGEKRSITLRNRQPQNKCHDAVKCKKVVDVKDHKQTKSKVAEKNSEDLKIRSEKISKTRACKVLKYRTSQLDTTVDKKVPIYRQVQEESKKNKKRDIYAFNAREEDLNLSLCDNPFDREMQEFLQNMEQRELKTNKKKTVRIQKKQVKFNNESTKPLTGDSKERALKQVTDTDLGKGVEIAHKKQAVTILSDISIVPPQIEDNDILKDDNQISFRRPNANSTMMGCPSPWRPNLVVRGTPHLLLTKSSNLPIYEQDLVLNSTLIEKSSQSPLSLAPKRHKQTTILSYFGDPSNKENELELTLFDENLLSPIKRTNRSPVKRTNRSPRKVLGDYNFQQRELSSEDQSDFSFGCNSTLLPVTGTAKPTRISIGEVRKVFGTKRKGNEEVVQLRNEAPSSENIEEVTGPVPGLFEDLEKEAPKNTYGRKKTKRQRYFSVHEEQSEDEEQPVKRKRRDVLTKSEEEEAEKWAASFNAMCKEIEAHTLEIE